MSDLDFFGDFQELALTLGSPLGLDPSNPSIHTNFLCQKSSESFQKKFSLKNMKLGAQLSLMTLFV